MTTVTRRERRERQKRQRQHGQPRQRRGGGGFTNQLVIAGLIAGGAVLALLGLRAAGVFDPPAAAVDFTSPATAPGGDPVGTLMPDQGTEHIPVGQKGTYNSIPPTSGQHWSSAAPAAPAPWGIKDAMLPNEVTTHNLEHGGVVIAYNNLSPNEVDQLKGLIRAAMNSQFRKIILEPYPPLGDAKIALTSWRWLLKLQSVDQTQIIRFLRAHYADPNYAPEANIP